MLGRMCGYAGGLLPAGSSPGAIEAPQLAFRRRLAARAIVSAVLERKEMETMKRIALLPVLVGAVFLVATIPANAERPQAVKIQSFLYGRPDPAAPTTPNRLLISGDTIVPRGRLLQRSRLRGCRRRHRHHRPHDMRRRRRQRRRPRPLTAAPTRA